ncbi:MAG: YdcF family protein [Hyphomicrobiaceae bacterium]
MQIKKTYWRMGLGGLVALSIAGLVVGFLVFASAATRQPTGNPDRADAIVVLTGGPRRLAEAGRLLRENYGGQLLVSGVNPMTTRADIMRLTKIDSGLFECCVTVGYLAQNTHGNAIEAMQWQRSRNLSSLIVVTESFHMPRSMAELATAMPEVKLIPHAVLPDRLKSDAWWRHSGYTLELGREYIKYLRTAAQLGLTSLAGQDETERSIPDGAIPQRADPERASHIDSSTSSQ